LDLALEHSGFPHLARAAQGVDRVAIELKREVWRPLKPRRVQASEMAVTIDGSRIEPPTVLPHELVEHRADPGFG
jgi:hypothetical protein